MTIRLVHEHVPAVHDDLPAVACRLCQLAGPRSVALYHCLEELRRHWVLRPEKIVADTTGGLVAGEAVKPFCAATPVNDRSRESPHEDRVVSLFQQVRLSPQGLLGLLALGDIVTGLQDRDRASMLVPLQSAAARHNDLRPISLCVNEFPFPAASLQQLCHDLPKRFGEARLEEFVSDVAHRLPSLPSV